MTNFIAIVDLQQVEFWCLVFGCEVIFLSASEISKSIKYKTTGMNLAIKINRHNLA